MVARASLFLIVLVTTWTLDLESFDELVVWNVGQGQWVTVVAGDTCWHFDAGGEFAPWGRVKRMCRAMNNRVTFSHWDSDHVGFAAKLKAALPNACVLAHPNGPTTPKKTALLAKLETCREAKPYVSWIDDAAKGSNGRSRVSWWREILIPGDATVTEEKRFVNAFRLIAQTRWLVLGHHGSQTSTSPRLLAAMTHLRGAIASARKKRYGHPHASVRARCARFGVPLFSTEDWGDVHVAL